MTQIFIGLDDTDAPGARNSTARLARALGETFAAPLRFAGSIGHILCADVKATTNNKASCIVLSAAAPIALEPILHEAHAFLAAQAAPKANPGLVVVSEASSGLQDFGRRASAHPVELDEALALVASLPHASFGSGAGLIGAAAAVGLTAAGWSGRWLEMGGVLRASDRAVAAADLRAEGVVLVSLETDAEVPKPDDLIDTRGWLRPQLLGGKAVLPLRRVDKAGWEVVSFKPPKKFH